MTRLFRIEGSRLVPASPSRLAREELLEDWVRQDPSIIGLDCLVLGRQVITGFGARIDLLVMQRGGDLVIIELKRDRTPRDVIAQALDYASWIATLSTADVHDLASRYLGRRLQDAYRERFDEALPETVNASHSIVIVASQLDPSSRRIVEYLSSRGGVAINTAFFSILGLADQQYLATDWLLDQEEVVERVVRRTRAPWSGLYYVNVGEGPHRSWEDMRRYGFLSAGYGRKFSSRLALLSPDDRICAYQSGAGYVGYGVVTSTAVMVREFETSDGMLLDQTLQQPNLAHDRDDPELAEYAVGVEWRKSFSVTDARTFPGVFANQHIVCKLSDEKTVAFLVKEFGIPDA